MNFFKNCLLDLFKISFRDSIRQLPTDSFRNYWSDNFSSNSSCDSLGSSSRDSFFRNDSLMDSIRSFSCDWFGKFSMNLCAKFCKDLQKNTNFFRRLTGFFHRFNLVSPEFLLGIPPEVFHHKLFQELLHEFLQEFYLGFHWKISKKNLQNFYQEFFQEFFQKYKDSTGYFLWIPPGKQLEIPREIYSEIPSWFSPFISPE